MSQLKNYTNEKKAYSNISLFKPGYWIDLKEGSEWRVARILSVVKEFTGKFYIMTRMDGWSEKYKDKVRILSDSIAPFRKYTQPYTGPSKRSDREDTSFSIEKLHQHREHLEKIARLEEPLDCQYLTQYVRGDLYVFIDTVLSQPIMLREKEYKQFINFIQMYIKLGVQIIMNGLSFLEEIGQLIRDLSLFVVHPRMAYLLCSIEIMNSFCNLIRSSTNSIRMKFYNQHQMVGDREDVVILKLKNVMISNGVEQLSEKILNLKMGDRTLPWSIRKEALNLLKMLGNNVELPQFDPRDANEIFELLPFFSQIYPSDLVEARQLNLIFQLVFSSNFQRKLKGLNELKNLIQRNVFKLKEAKLAEVLRQRNMLDYLTDNNNFTSQLFKRSTPIFDFMIRQKMFKNEHIEKIVSLSKSRHQSDLRLIYATLSEISKTLSQQQLDFLFSKLIELEIDDVWLNLIKQFTINAMARLNNSYDPYIRKKIENSEKYGYYGLNHLWNIIQDDSDLSGEMTLLAVAEFVQLLFSQNLKQEREKYITLCLKQMQKGVSFGQSMKILHLLLKYPYSSIVNDAILRADKQMNIIDLATTTLLTLINKGMSGGKLTLDQTIQAYFSFLEEIIPILRKLLTSTHIKLFWRMPNKTHLLNFLRKTKELVGEKDEKANRFYEKRLDNRFILELLENIFMVPEQMGGYANIDPTIFSTVDELFLSYHIRSKNIDYNHKNTIRIIRPDSINCTFYIRVLLAPNSDKIIDLAMKRLVELNIRPATKTPTLDINSKVQMWQKFTEEMFKEFSKNTHILLKIFKHFVESIEGRMKSINILSTSPTSIIVKCLDNDKTKTIILPCYSSLYKLRQRIGEEFDMKGKDFEMHLKENGFYSTFTQEEDFSLAVIHNNTENPNAPLILVTGSKDTHPHVRAQYEFLNWLADSKDNKLQQLYNVVDQLQGADLDICFELLLQLPKVQQFKKRLQGCQLDGHGWNGLLPSGSLRKLYYQLMIVQGIKTSKWVQNFLERKGVDHMINILVKIKPSSLGQKYDLTSCSFLVKLLSQFIQFSKLTLQTAESIQIEAVSLLTSAIQHSTKETPQLVTNCFRLMNSVYRTQPAMIKSFYQNKQVDSILKYALFMENSNDFINIFYYSFDKSGEMPDTHRQIIDKVMSFLNVDFLEPRRSKCQTYFCIVNKILLEILKKPDQAIVNLLSNFINSAKKLTYLEKSITDYDALLNGWMSLTRLINKQTGISVEDIVREKDGQLVQWLLHECLFPSKEKSQSAKCKSVKNRTQAFQLLSLVNSSKQQCLSDISNLLVPILKKSAWRKPGEWSIAVTSQPSREFRGLKNLSATCYINSLMQQLYHIKQFRQALLKARPDNEEEDTLFEVQKIFAHLKNSDAASYTPRSFCANFKHDGANIDPRVQMDADQFFNSLMDKLDTALKACKQQHIINNIFQGQQSNQIICQGCPHESQRTQDFLSLGVTVKNKSSLQQALKQFIKGEILDGDNAYYCQKCQKKVRCLKRACIKELPNVLIIVLKRFEFDFDTMQKVKLNDYCEFPLNLDMKPYTKEFLSEKQEFRPNSYYEYTLKGTVIHHGTSEAGHYYSYIKIAKDQWYEFNDEWIDKFDLADLKDEAFGGAEESQYLEGEKKAKNAYILFYQRNENYVNGEVGELPPLPQPKISRALEAVHEDNLRNEYVRVAFDSNLIAFLQNNLTTKEGKLALLYTHLVIFRSKDRSQYLQSYLEKADYFLRRESKLSDWYIQNIGQPFLRQFLFDAVKEVKYSTLSLIDVALRTVKPNADFVKRCLGCLAKKGMTPFAKIFYLIARTSKESTKILAENDYANRVLRLITEQQSTTRQPPQPYPSQFGESSHWEEPLKEELCYHTLLHSLQNFPIKYEDIKRLTPKRMKSARYSMGKIICRAIKNKEVFEKTYQNMLQTEMMRTDDEKEMQLYIRVMKELISQKDEYAEERTRRVAEVHINVMKECQMYYVQFNLLLDALFKFCSKNMVYRTKISQLLTENKNYLYKMLKNWISESGSPAMMIRPGRFHYTKSQTSAYPVHNIPSILQNHEQYYLKRRDMRMDRLGKLFDKEEYDYDESVEELEWVVGAKYEYISAALRYISFEVQKKVGLFYLIKMDNTLKLQLADEDIN